ncbi:folylpolyglutamate synthase/dihydrofolate synthase family protein [Leptolyngbya sp. FACHB-261]|uniref:bifunctional folylpolyglutamate synthase/dihydrofolate synthase n=1 Tax=Leptolyngbya sp. FACHB-261 TaxID=2692806 RepID=UPI00168A3EC9|nr:folylpolyglutamate synthase/dihydrofolate synthase family protein [Leptolyngbya sp. FACHB-261]MBD2100146.1 bifunctional folylpolyglutamate synthase/dihydrofolate synthase [Leptolyngbya sp. FACHB-261]
MTSAAQILSQYERFGVHLGLERIQALLARLGNPQQRVPVLHVAGTNGKGSVCAYLSSVLRAAGYRVGRYTSPHLVNWRERICLNDTWIAEADLVAALTAVQQAIDPNPEDSATQFEVITAAAWWYFAQQQVDVAVIEVGLGGRLDATNVNEQPLVSVITSLSREHWQRLGPTLADIAYEKAGILKPQRPAVIGPLPAEADAVVTERLKVLDCPTVRVEPAQDLGNGRATWQGIEYPLALFGAMQLTNSAIALAVLQCLRQQGWQISDAALEAGFAQTRWPGRLQWVTWTDAAGQPHKLLIDGAHNVAAAEYLRQFVDAWLSPTNSPTTDPTTWVMGMLSTKDHVGILKTLLRPQDRLFALPVPDHSTLQPESLVQLARALEPKLSQTEAHQEFTSALSAAFAQDYPVVLCGSLYLVGQFLALYPADPQ